MRKTDFVVNLCPPLADVEVEAPREKVIPLGARICFLYVYIYKIRHFLRVSLAAWPWVDQGSIVKSEIPKQMRRSAFCGQVLGKYYIAYPLFGVQSDHSSIKVS